MRKIWNRPADSVWSLSTIDEHGVGNMNICTYVTSVSLRPKLMLVALYHYTHTLKNVEGNGRALLQLLGEPHTDIIRVCGKQSGRAKAKLPLIEQKHPIKTWNGLPYLADAAGFIELTFSDLLEVGGDHKLGVGAVVTSKNLNEVPLLTTAYLRKKNLIR